MYVYYCIFVQFPLLDFGLVLGPSLLLYEWCCIQLLVKLRDCGCDPQLKCLGAKALSVSTILLHIFHAWYNLIASSQSFGQADHKLTQQLLCKKFKYPEGNVTWSNAGYWDGCVVLSVVAAVLHPLIVHDCAIIFLVCTAVCSWFF